MAEVQRAALERATLQKPGALTTAAPVKASRKGAALPARAQKGEVCSRSAGSPGRGLWARDCPGA